MPRDVIEAIVKKIQTEACKLVPFAYAILGCDTTSWVHELNKNIVLKQLRDNKELRQMHEVFLKLRLRKKRLK